MLQPRSRTRSLDSDDGFNVARNRRRARERDERRARRASGQSLETSLPLPSGQLQPARGRTAVPLRQSMHSTIAGTSTAALLPPSSHRDHDVVMDTQVTGRQGDSDVDEEEDRDERKGKAKARCESEVEGEDGEEEPATEDDENPAKYLDLDDYRNRASERALRAGMDLASPRTIRYIDRYVSHLNGEAFSSSPDTAVNNSVASTPAIPAATQPPPTQPPRPLRPEDEDDYASLDQDLQVALAEQFEEGAASETEGKAEDHQETATRGSGRGNPKGDGYESDSSTCSSDGGDDDPMPGGDDDPFNASGPYDYKYYKNWSRFQGNSPQPGRQTAVDRLTQYRHKDSLTWLQIPSGKRAPRINSYQEEEAAELEAKIIMEESGPSESDYSETRKAQSGGGCKEEASENSENDEDDNDGSGKDEKGPTRRPQSRGRQEGSRPELNEVDNEKVSESKVDKGKAKASDDSTNKGSRPSKGEDEEIEALSNHIFDATSHIGVKYNKSIESVVKQIGLKLPGMGRSTTSWNLFQSKKALEGATVVKGTMIFTGGLYRRFDLFF